MPIEKFMKITYHDGSGKKINAYLKMPSPTFAVLQREIGLCLFEERKLPRHDLKTFWIDEDGDEIEIFNQCDYDIFMLKRSERQHLQVAPVTMAASTPAPAAEANEATSTADPTDDPTNFIIHERVECDGCNVSPLIGFRYKCIQCPNYDLCQRCEAQHKHADHMMVRMPNDNCPNVVEAYLTGGRCGRRRGSKRNNTGNCPFVPTGNMGFYGIPGTQPPQADDSNAKKEGKDHYYHHERKHHHRRSMRQGLFSHLYDMMQDFAEGGAANREQHNADSNGTKQQETTGAANAEAQKAAKAAREAHEAAAKAAKIAAEAVQATVAANIQAAQATTFAATADNADAEQTARVAREAAQESAQKIAHSLNTAAANVFAPTAPKSAETTAESMENELNENADVSGSTTPEDNASKIENDTETKKPSQSNIKTNIPVTPSFENLVQYLDPQYMKAGIQILNNFSEMFTKMMDPMEDDDNASTSCPFQNVENFQKRKSSASSTTSKASSTATAAHAPTVSGISTPTTSNENILQPEMQPMSEQNQAKPADAVATEAALITPTKTAEPTTEQQATPDRRRSQSDEGDWQLIENQLNSSNDTDFDSVSVRILGNSPTDSIDSNAGAAALATPNTTTGAAETSATDKQDYKKLSQDLRAHVAKERQRELEIQQIRKAHAALFAANADNNKSVTTTSTTAAASAATSTATTTATTTANRAETSASTSESTGTKPKAAEEKRTVYHHDARINESVHTMMAMGFSNEGAWLTQLLESVNGNISSALDVMSVAHK